MNTLKDDIFRILYLYEQENSGLGKYIDTVRRRLIGAAQTYDMGDYESRYMNVVSSIQYLAIGAYDAKECRRVVLDAVNEIGRIQTLVGGDLDES